MNGSEGNAFRNSTTDVDTYSGSGILQTLWKNGKWEIPLYSIIFLIAVVGNLLVISTLCKKNRAKTVTNVFFLNLAVSDLVLTVFCMPFTLTANLLRTLIFGKWMCKVIPFIQTSAVATSVWTLVALSVERYYAICHPLQSRKWQTLSHARRLVATIWIMGVGTVFLPLILVEGQPIERGRHDCKEKWPNGIYERAYNVLLILILFVVPLTVLGVTYYLIASSLRKDLEGKDVETDNPAVRVVEVEETSFTEGAQGGKRDSTSLRKRIAETSFMHMKRKQRAVAEGKGKAGKINRTYAIGLRHTNYEMVLQKKQRAIRMLYVVVLEFFICWTPLYVFNTLALFFPQMVHSDVGHKVNIFCQLLAYSSGCCNPITYCFMNKTFRTRFIKVFSCFKSK